jgi:hypothetical protein
MLILNAHPTLPHRGRHSKTCIKDTRFSLNRYLYNLSNYIQLYQLAK